ncbi:MAG: hypothetical protein M1821_007257 [Bathelium mastoideum]|nr:MAG: hypothetical protein M1821_007257 [Bathelium mastoideum]KAI9694761.1 MAG: hypothetical protein M1822_000377 [Bathelium mastoideum]
MSRRTDGPDLASPKAQRSMSMSSDRPSLSGISAMHAGVHPAPAYVAASVASQMVTDHHINEGEEINGIDDGALFSEGALALLNAFLDNLLYSFLASAKSTSLIDLRPAIADTLKTRLARDAMASADEDLADLLTGTEDDEDAPQNGSDANGKWDLEMVWRRTRLRVMVYIRLGEIEDEDEERYLEEDEYFSSDNRRFSRSNGLISWVAAIFLTFVIEYMAEQTIICGGRAAYARALKRKASDARSATEIDYTSTRIIVEESDMEKIALDSTLSRLWRTWRRRLRQPSSAASTPAPSRIGTRSGSVTSPKMRNLSFDGADGGLSEGDDFRTPSSAPETEISKGSQVYEAPENIPLPMGQRDVDEIEVPGLARTFEDDSEEEDDSAPPRRASFVTLMRSKDDSVAVQDDEIDERPILRRARSRSLPVPGAFTNDGLREQFFENTAASNAKSYPEKTDESPDTKDIEEKSEPQIKRKSLLATGASMAAAGAAAAYAHVMGTRKQDEPPTPISPSTDGGRSFQAREAHSKEIDDVLDAQVLDSKRVSVIRPIDAPEIVRHESGSSYSTSRSYSLSSKVQEATTGREGEAQKEKPGNVSPLQERGKPWPGASVPKRSVSPPSPMEDRSRRIPTQRRGSPDADDDARKLERIAKATATPAAVTAVAGAGAAALAARRHPNAVSKANAQPWDEPSAEQFFAAASLQGPSRDRSPSYADKSTENVNRQRTGNDYDVPAATLKKEKLRKPLPSDSRALAPAKSSDRGNSSESVASSSSNLKGQTLTVETKDKSPSASPAEWSSRGSPVARRTTRGSKSSIDSLGDQHAQVTPISASSARRRDFDSLVKGEETMKYTLTPQGMRDLDKQSPAVALKEVERPRASSKSTKQSQEQPRPVEVVSTAQNTQDRNFPARSSSVTNKTSSNKTYDAGQTSGRPSTAKSGARPPQKNYLGTKQGLVAREPQVQTVSTKDLADFFQTTAPAKEPDPVMPLSLNRTQSQPNAAGRKQSESSASSKPGRRNSFNKSPSRGSVTSPKSGAPPLPTTTVKKSNLQARDAVTPASGSSDLIDFIRQGPPPGMNVNQSQPFNLRSTTRDSSTGGTVSARTSANSRTALIAQPNGSSSPSSSVTQLNKQSLAPPGASSSMGSGAPDLGKKRYRNKDPYAIDFDDEDDDLLTALPHAGKPKRQEESLIDFLNSVEPPTLNGPKPLLNGSQSSASKGKSDQPNTLKKAEPASRSRSQGAGAESKRTPSAPTSPTPSASRPNRDGLLSTTTRRASPGSPEPTLNPLSMNSPTPPATRPTSVSNSNSNSTATPTLPTTASVTSGSTFAPDFSAANKPKPKFETRSPGTAKGAGSAARLDAFHTDDLADFLRSSGPPEGAGAPAPVVGRGRLESGKVQPQARQGAQGGQGGQTGQTQPGKRRFPWQRKTYLDMP